MKLKNNDSKGIMNESFIEFYVHFLYRNFGRFFFSKKNFKDFFYRNFYNIRYEGVLRKANLRLIPEEYFFAILFSLILMIVLVFIMTFANIFIRPEFTQVVFFGGVLAVSLMGIFFYNFPIVTSNNRGQEINASMPYLLPYMKILAKELSLSKIVEIIGDFLIYKEIRIEFEKIRYYSTVLGYDIHSSIREAMASCPSRELADLMNDLVTISNSGGNIYNYLDRKLNNLNIEIDAIEKKTIDTLLIYSQVYVVVLLISPLFYTIMTTILNLVNITSTQWGAGSSDSGSVVMYIFALLVFLPLFYGAFMMLVYYSKPLYSRLKPIKNEITKY
ncbi:MAG: type II secretion system F family protein [Candidatus Woesearchaeota archaeon]|jgi:archaellum biogenesis protein FlaJ (TadC family)|nr:type II secretion system F family protein [Candidatus Woesearchaeota archaeon]